LNRSTIGPGLLHHLCLPHPGGRQLRFSPIPGTPIIAGALRAARTGSPVIIPPLRLGQRDDQLPLDPVPRLPARHQLIEDGNEYKTTVLPRERSSSREKCAGWSNSACQGRPDQRSQTDVGKPSPLP
jgi:hypothetical protein